MAKIIIECTLEEELTSDEYTRLFDVLMQLGAENIEIKEGE